jgi:uncharacterized RDD family membrane protein YckC
MASEAVYFASSDYAGFWRRVLVEVADVFAIAFLLVLLTVILSSVLAEGGLLLFWAATIYWYFVIAKHSRFRTIGYRLGRVRIVNAYGQPPSQWALSLRLLFAVVGPLNFVLDILWIPSDPCKQSLRDKLAHSYVVKQSAQAAGRARVVYRNYYILGMAFVFQEIEPLAPSRAS